MHRLPLPRRDSCFVPIGSIALVALTALLGVGGLIFTRILPSPLLSTTMASAPALREFTLTAQEVDWEIMPGTTVRAWTYNGQMPGPEARGSDEHLS